MAYDFGRPIRLIIREMIEQLTPDPDSIFTVRDAIEWLDDHYPGINRTTIKAQLYSHETNARGRGAFTQAPGWDLLYAVAPRTWRRYNPATDPTPVHRTVEQEQLEEDEGDVDTIGMETGDGEFAMEAHLRDALARNMGLIEPGLTLVDVEADAGNGRRIDLLGRAPDGAYVVVELKVSKGYDRVVGQLLRYRAWVSQQMADGRPVRGVIIARTISDDLRLACSGLPDVRLVEYAMTVQLTDVTERR